MVHFTEINTSIMTPEQEFKHVIRRDFPSTVDNLIFRTENGVYSVFDKYKIVPQKPGYLVYCSATEVGLFGSTKTALSWCIADKYQNFTLAKDILDLDTKLTSLTADIAIRAQLADRSRNYDFRENVETKLESKLIHKKAVEAKLSKCVNWAKYYQQKGFNQNETIRTGRNQAVKTSR